MTGQRKRRGGAREGPKESERVSGELRECTAKMAGSYRNQKWGEVKPLGWEL